MESRVQRLVRTLLDEAYDPLPPKPEFGDVDAEMQFYTRNPFMAWERAQEISQHHPALWQAVKGSPYESLYRRKFKITESCVPNWKKLQKGRVELDPNERREVLRRGVVWHFSHLKKPTPAVWKSKVNGKIYYICNTHRAAAVKTTLKAAIKAYKFIETTS